MTPTPGRLRNVGLMRVSRSRLSGRGSFMPDRSPTGPPKSRQSVPRPAPRALVGGHRIGVDIGGTFTDLVAYDESTGLLRRSKSLTTPEAPEQGLLNACREAAVDFSQISYFMHATTLVTNLIVTRSGARVGVLTTTGFRDILEIGKGDRNELYDPQWDKPRHFVPRHLVRELDERIDHSGRVLIPIDAGAVAVAVQGLVDDGVEAIAVSLFNSYANPVHEIVVGRVVRDIAPKVYVSLSSDIDPRIREYERVSTTVLNAYSMPRMQGYGERLDSELGTPVKYMHSGGGVISSAVAMSHPITLVVSGPAAGVLAARFLGQQVGIRNIITADVGGTSFDVSVIRDGEPQERDIVEVEWGIPARVQAIDVNSIGAGGGSIAYVDAGGSLKVGPQSAGASPGPACYDQGGDQPTVTDANLILGILDAKMPLAGTIRLNLERAREALGGIARHFGVSVGEAALGIYRVVNAHMAQAILEGTVRKGIDPRDFTLIAFGGAGGQHAAAVAQEAGIRRALFPPFASTFSALGLLVADLRYTTAKTFLRPIASLDLGELKQALGDLETQARSSLQGEEGSITRIVVEQVLDMRYLGQSNEVAVRLRAGIALEPETLYAEFERQHYRLYGTHPHGPAEIVNLRVTVAGLVRPLKLAKASGPPSTAKPKAYDRREVALLGPRVPVFHREDLSYGMELPTPAIIEEVDTTVVLPEGARAHVDAFGNIVCELPDPKARPSVKARTRSAKA